MFHLPKQAISGILGSAAPLASPDGRIRFDSSLLECVVCPNPAIQQDARYVVTRKASETGRLRKAESVLPQTHTGTSFAQTGDVEKDIQRRTPGPPLSPASLSSSPRLAKP